MTKTAAKNLLPSLSTAQKRALRDLLVNGQIFRFGSCGHATSTIQSLARLGFGTYENGTLTCTVEGI